MACGGKLEGVGRRGLVEPGSLTAPRRAAFGEPRTVRVCVRQAKVGCQSTQLRIAQTMAESMIDGSGTSLNLKQSCHSHRFVETNFVRRRCAVRKRVGRRA